MAKRRGRNSRGVGNKEKDDKEKDEEKEKDKEPGASQGSQKKDEKEQERQKRRRRERKERKEKAGIDLEKVARQLDFYFSDANLRRDRYMKKTLDEGDGAVSLEILLNFNRIKALGVTKTSQLLEAVQCSGMLDLVEEGTKVRRDFQKHPLGTYDPVSRTLYVEGLPLTLGVDDLKKFFSDYGQVKLVEVPQHRETREPRGFAFVEFGDVQEADAALRGCNGLWPSMWPSRFDGKKLRLMWKAEWHQQCREYKLLQATSRGPTFEGRPKGDPPATPSRSVPAVPDVPTVPDVRDGAGEAAVPESGATGSTEPTASAAESSEVEKPRPSRTPGCLVKLTGFSGDDELLCTLAIRQFAEHAVTVEYCDYVPSASTALLRLKCPEDTATLLEDMKLTGRMLGCQQPTAEVLGREEEEKYWHDVMQRAQQRGPQQRDARSQPHDTTKQTAKRREPENVVTRIRRWRPVSNPNRSKFRAGFTDTAGGSANFVASGFGKRKEKRAPKVIPPRKREEEAGPSASSKAKKVEKEKEKVPLVPPPSPFQLPGTTRKRRRGTQVPPPSPAALPPPSPCGRSESMSPESDAASAEPPVTGQPPPEPPEGELEFDPDDIVSMMEDFH